MNIKKKKTMGIKSYILPGLGILLGVMVFSTFSITVLAQERPITFEQLNNIREASDFVVGPGKAEIVLNPGETRIINIMVTNRMGEEKTFLLEVEDFTGSRDLEQAVVLLGDQRGPYSLRDYISVPNFEFTLQHGQRANIPVSISIPSDEEPGGRFGSLVVSTATKPVDRETGAVSPGAAIVSRIGSLIFVRIPGDVEESGHLQDFKTKLGKKFFGGSPIDFEILYENTGSVHLNPYGEIRMSNILGKEVGRIELEPWFTLPDSIRLREISWEQSPLFGVYTAHASINRGYENIVDEAKYTFFVLPWKLTVIVLLSLLILILILRFLFSRFEFRRKNPE